MRKSLDQNPKGGRLCGALSMRSRVYLYAFRTRLTALTDRIS
jgi:hypothetical protein